MNLRAGVAVGAARMAGALSRALGRGGGTALPGLIAERLAPDVLRTLALQIPRGSLVITGTNGKTTTSHMLAAIFARSGITPLRNGSGSNLWRGVATALAAKADMLGRLRVHPNTIGLFETDEAAFARVVPELAPRAVVVTNLFRDQLDRYGEVDTVAVVWRIALDRLVAEGAARDGLAGAEVALILNGDDPTVAALGGAFAPAPPPGRRAIYFGIDDKSLGAPGTEHASDAKTCPQCGSRLVYERSYYGHLGHYTCGNGHRRPVPHVVARSLETHGFDGTTIQLSTPQGDSTVRLPLPGIYNVYNALAASAAALEAGATLQAVREGLEGFSAAFGRLERISVGDKAVVLVLAKNPVGMNEALRTVFGGGAVRHLLLALNDLDADGLDISWIWDADFEHVAGHARSLVVAGLRADDLALRLKYAGALGDAPLQREPHLGRALDLALREVPPGESLFCVLTYTAMLDLRRVLTSRGYAQAYWDE